MDVEIPQDEILDDQITMQPVEALAESSCESRKEAVVCRPTLLDREISDGDSVHDNTVSDDSDEGLELAGFERGGWRFRDSLGRILRK